MLAHHPPAVKVAGRRLSTTTRPKPSGVQDSHPTEDIDDINTEAADYPRPAPPVKQDDEIIRQGDAQKEKKQGYGNPEKDKKHGEVLHKKPDDNMPTREFAQKRDQGIRIAQPAGKGVLA